jgi:hypothetical protein
MQTKKVLPFNVLVKELSFNVSEASKFSFNVSQALKSPPKCAKLMSLGYSFN